MEPVSLLDDCVHALSATCRNSIPYDMSGSQISQPLTLTIRIEDLWKSLPAVVAVGYYGGVGLLHHFLIGL